MLVIIQFAKTMHCIIVQFVNNVDSSTSTIKPLLFIWASNSVAGYPKFLQSKFLFSLLQCRSWGFGDDPNVSLLKNIYLVPCNLFFYGHDAVV